MIFAIRGDILYTKKLGVVSENIDSYIICEDGIVKGVYKTIPSKYKNIKVYDYKNKLIIPGLVDTHLHAPQYSFIGMHMDLPLLLWLNKYTFKEETQYKNMAYAKKAYNIFIKDLKKSPTTRFSLFATIHVPATLYLMEELEKTNLVGFVGKVNMDRNSIKSLQETTDKSLKDTLFWIKAQEKLKRIKPIITPRFVPSCSLELLKGLSKIANEYKLPIQSHLSENKSEIELVKSLHKESSCYGSVYDDNGLFGNTTNTIMAHCVWSEDKEINLMKNKKLWVAHCPSSNRNLSSGMAPIRRYLDEGIKVSLATDVAGGSYLSMFRAMEDAITMSKMRECMVDKNLRALNIKEVFYLATKGGGEFFGKVGSFETGYELDAIVLDEKDIPTVHMDKLKLIERFERFVYRPNDKLIAKFVAGKKININ